MALVRRFGIVVGLTILAVVLHEAGHFVVYRLTGVAARVSLQSVRPVGAAAPPVEVMAGLGGPLVSVIAAIAFLAIVRRRASFVVATLAFSNASLRIFPCSMDLARALRGAPPFSDEGHVAFALGHGVVARSAFLLACLLVYVALSIESARQYHFERHGAFKSMGIYALSLTVGVGIVIVDELLGWNRA